VDGSFGATVYADTGVMNLHNITIGDDFSGNIESAGAMAFSIFDAGRNFSGTIVSENSTVTAADMFIDGDFSGMVKAATGMTFDVVGIGGDMTGTFETTDGDFFVSLDSFTVDGAFDGQILAADNLTGGFWFNYEGTNNGSLKADTDGDLLGDLNGTLDADGSFSSSTMFVGEDVGMSFDIDGDFFGSMQALSSGFAGPINIGGDFGGSLFSAMALDSLIIGGRVLDGPNPIDINVTDDVGTFHAFGLGANVVLKALGWDNVVIGCAGIDSAFGELLAGNEPGTGYIENLRIEGQHPMGALLENVIHGVKTGLWQISDSMIIGKAGYTFQVEGGGNVLVKAKGGDVYVWYFDSELNDGRINEITSITYLNGIKLNLTVTGSSKLSPTFPDIGYLGADIMHLGGQNAPTGFYDIALKNVGVDDIEISGSAHNIAVTNGDVGDVSIGNPACLNVTYKKVVGNLASLTVKGGDIDGDVDILSSLSGKITANNIHGDMWTFGATNNYGSFGTIEAAGQWDADLTVYGNLKGLTAKNAAHLANDIEIYGSLGSLSMQKAQFTGIVNAKNLSGNFDVLGKANAATRTVSNFYTTTVADYATGGTLTVFNIIKGSHIQ